MSKKLLILMLCMSCVSLLEANAFGSHSTTKKETIKAEKAESKTITCSNCPCNCLIKMNQIGECGQYKNVDGKIVPVEKNSKSK